MGAASCAEVNSMWESGLLSGTNVISRGAWVELD